MGDMGSDYADDRARRREERRRRRAEEKEKERQRELYEQQQENTISTTTSVTTVSSVTSVHTPRSTMIETVYLKKSASKMSREQSEEKMEINEAEQKAEAIRLKREQEQEERYREKMEELRRSREKGEQELLEMEERKERRRLKLEAEERRLQQEQEEKEAREAEDAKKRREEIQKRRQEAEERRRNIQNSMTYTVPNYSTSDDILQAEKVKAMSHEERAAHKKRHLEECIPPLNISSSTSAEKLRELVQNLQVKLVQLYEAKFDLMKRKERQQYDLTEMQARIEDLSKVNAPKKPVVTVNSGLVSKIKEKGFFVEDKPVKKSFLQERNEGIAASGGVQGRLNMFQNKVEMHQGDDQPDIKRSGRSSWKAPEYDKCSICNKNVYTLERLEVAKKLYHKQCFKCEYCKKVTSLSNYALFDGKIYCKPHQRKVERESLQQGIGMRH